MYCALFRISSLSLLCSPHREYALRRVRDGFRKAKSLTAEADQKREMEMAKESLQVIKRQVRIF